MCVAESECGRKWLRRRRDLDEGREGAEELGGRRRRNGAEEGVEEYVRQRVKKEFYTVLEGVEEKIEEGLEGS